MTLAEKTRSTLAAWPPFASGQQTLSVDESGQRLVCELTGLDAFGCVFVRFELHSDALSNATMERVREISKSLSARLTYLLEPIAPIESDAEQCIIQMRSNPPQRDEQGTSYYELLVRRGGALSLCRWNKAPGDIASGLARPGHPRGLPAAGRRLLRRGGVRGRRFAGFAAGENSILFESAACG